MMDDEDINGEIVDCTDIVRMVEAIAPLDSLSSAKLTFSHLYHFFDGLDEDVTIIATNARYVDIEEIPSLVIHVCYSGGDSDDLPL